MRHSVIVAAGAVLVALTGGPASACSAAASGVAFGALGLLDAPIDSAGEIDVTCPSGTSYAVELDGGLSSAPPEFRKLSSGSDTIAYGLYRNAARSDPWGEGSESLSGSGTGSLQTLPVYGRIHAQSSASPGTYSDTIVVTVIY